MGSTAVEEYFAIPQWLTNVFLSEVPSKEMSAPVSMIDFDAEATVSKGDNYLSTLYRIVATYNGQDDVDKSYLIEYHREVCVILKVLRLEKEVISLQQFKEEFVEKEMFGFMNASNM
ncbi:hypothetical protein C0J52_26848 [Blattella germanica]|nr:hypothetical protein C0J52_26848 [Blattella germanica]